MQLAERIMRGRRAIVLARERGVDVSEWRRHLEALIEQAGQEQEFEPWALWEWRRVSIPQWRHILKKAIGKGDRHRERYARDMLRDVLLDPEYEEPES